MEKIKKSLDEEPKGDFKTNCPFCKKKDCLHVVYFVWNGEIPLEKDGFALCDARHTCTSDELVECSECRKTFPLAKVTR